jgi:hypothetical protein
MSYLSWSGHCLIQTSKPDFEVDEFLAMVEQGLNAMVLYAPWLSKIFDIARSDAAVLSALKEMGQVHYTGAALNPDDEIWATEQGIPVTVRNLQFNRVHCTIVDNLTGIVCYHRDRCERIHVLVLSRVLLTTYYWLLAGVLVTPLAEKGILPGMRVIEGIDVKFIPTRGLDHAHLDGDSEQRTQGGKLFDLFFPVESDNCPHASIRNRPDGHITGDLFEEVKPGVYCFRACLFLLHRI